MSDHSTIEWTDATWNPVRGCTKISPGCKHCYAETFAERFRGVPGHPYEQGFDLRTVPEKLAEPLRWPKPRMVFVNSMSDPLPQGCHRRVHRSSRPCHADGELAHLPVAHQTLRAPSDSFLARSSGQPPPSRIFGGELASKTRNMVCPGSVICGRPRRKSDSCRSNHCWKTSARSTWTGSTG